jgi:hypothetical protein
MVFSRRHILIGAAALAPASRLLVAKEFWETKDPGTWTDEEILSLTSKSPWARLAVLDVKGTDDPVGQVQGGRGSGRGGAESSSPTALVRWESAQPMLDALKTRMAPEFDGHYVLSVNNLSIRGLRLVGRGADPASDELIQRLQAGALLQPKGKDPAEAGVARRTRTGVLLFGFAKDYLHLSANDREITFSLSGDGFTLKTKFDAKDMMYRGKLAV